MNEKLLNYTKYIKSARDLNKKLKGNLFPSKKEFESDHNEAHLRLIIDQVEKLLSDNNKILGFDLRNEDKLVLKQHFVNDLEQFSTANNITISDEWSLSFSQSKISAHAFYHLATSKLLPETYKTIDLMGHKGTFDVYSIPFKIRVALENKIKSIIGFESCDVTRFKKTKYKTDDFPVSLVLQELKKLKCFDLPCSLDDLMNIYSWSCSFCHTGKKEYLWTSMKALEILSLLFLYCNQKKNEIDVSDLWKEYSLSSDDLIEKLMNYKGMVNPIYYFKDGWSVKLLENKFNTSKNKNLQPYSFNLSEVALEEPFGFYCSKTKNTL